MTLKFFTQILIAYQSYLSRTFCVVEDRTPRVCPGESII